MTPKVPKKITNLNFSKIINRTNYSRPGSSYVLTKTPLDQNLSDRMHYPYYVH